MTEFHHNIKVTSNDIDELGHVNNVVYVRWVQDVASAHWDSVATSSMKSDYLWVVLRHEIDYKNPCFLGDTINGTTWVGEHYGARFERFVKLQLNSGKIAAEAKTTWCLLDRASMKPIRIPDAVLSVF